MNNLVNFLRNFFTYDLLKSVFLEVWKRFITLFFAYVSFRFFQNYKEKKQHNKVYMKMLKLESDINKNIEKIDKILMLYKEGRNLYKKFHYYNIADRINNIISLYYITDESYTDSYNDEISRFYRYPFQYIRELEYEIYIMRENGENNRELGITECKLEKVKRMDIMNDLIELMDLITESDKDKTFNEVVLSLEDFNNKNIESKEKILNKFCENILLCNEKVKELMANYNRYNILYDRLIKNKEREQVILKFKQIDDKEEEFASYDPEFYFKVENRISEFNSRCIFIDEKNILEETNKELLSLKLQLDEKIKGIKKKIDSTEVFFGN